MSNRSRKKTKSIDYSRLNSLGLEGSIKQQAMTGKDGENDGILLKETLPETEVTGDGTDPAEAGAMASEAEKPDGNKNIGFITVHGLNEGHIAPYTDTEFQLTEYQTYIIMKSQVKSLQLILEETITLLTKIKRVKQMALKQYFTTG